MNIYFEQYKALDIDGRLVSLEHAEEIAPYFCYPINAEAIGFVFKVDKSAAKFQLQPPVDVWLVVCNRAFWYNKGTIKVHGGSYYVFR